MALSSTLYQFHVNLSDVDRGIYKEVELRVPLHPSETISSLLTRVIAFGLNLQEGLEFTQGISNPDLPSLWVKDLTGAIQVWIDVGSPSAKRLHKASKTARSVRVYTYRDPEILIREVAGSEIHRIMEIEFFALDPSFLKALGKNLERQNRWELLFAEGEVSVITKEETYQCDLKQLDLRTGA